MHSGFWLKAFPLAFLVTSALPQWVYALDQSYLVCYSKGPRSERGWDWAALPGKETALSVSGYWVHDVFRSEDIFLIDQLSEDQLQSVCRETIQRTRGSGYFLQKVRAGTRAFLPDHEVRVIESPSLALLQKVEGSLSDLIFQVFLPWSKEFLDRDGPSRMLAQTLSQAVLDHSELREKLISYLEEGERYAQDPEHSIQWMSDNPSERVIQFVRMFENETDYRILTYSIWGKDGGPVRGPFNSFIDMVTSHPLSEFGNLPYYQVQALSKVFANIAMLYGTLDRVKKMDAKTDPVILKEFVLVLSETLSAVTHSLGELDSLILRHSSSRELKELKYSFSQAFLRLSVPISFEVKSTALD